MTRTILGALVLVILVVIGLVMPYGQSGDRGQIAIATAGPITGQYAVFGEQMKRGAEMAVADLNAAGGVLGRQLKLLIDDDVCDPKQAVAVANKLVNQGAVAVIGHFCSGSSIPASDVYREEGVIQISPASTNPTFTDRNYENVFRVCGRDDQQGATAGAIIAEKGLGSRIAIIHDKSAYGKGLADEVKKNLNAKGVNEAMYEAINVDDKDFSALITKFKAGDIDLIYLGGYHTQAALIVRQAREQGLSAQLMSGDALATDEFAKIAGPAAEGVLYTFSPDPARNPEAADVVAKFRAQGINPEGYTLYTYAAYQAWAQAVTKAGSTDAEAVAAALKGGTFDTVMGKISFDDKGDVTAPGYVLWQIVNGKADYAKL